MREQHTPFGVSGMSCCKERPSLHCNTLGARPTHRVFLSGSRTVSGKMWQSYSGQVCGDVAKLKFAAYLKKSLPP